jgi:hypothetical protein
VEKDCAEFHDLNMMQVLNFIFITVIRFTSAQDVELAVRVNELQLHVLYARRRYHIEKM